MNIPAHAVAKVRRAILQHAHEAVRRGDHEEARALFAQLGISYVRAEAN